MPRSIGITTAKHIVTGVVENRELVSALGCYPAEGSSDEELLTMPADQIAQRICREIGAAAQGSEISAIGVGFPGVIRNGIIEEAPNLLQLKGANMCVTLTAALRDAGIDAPVFIYNDADIVAAGLAATRGQLDRRIRVWTLGTGIGFGTYPMPDGIWEGGHYVVSLDPAEHFCGCGGVGHVEGIMGNRAMRLRFLDMEPDEIFENARAGDRRCSDFVKLWHRALAAATSNSVHMAGPGKFFISGFNAKHVDVSLLNRYMSEMVKMSPLQGYVFEIVPGGDEIAVIGAAVNAERAIAGR
jgi:glucokinase